MKKTVMLIALTLVLASCNVTKTVRDSKKIMKGDWTLSSITYNQQGTFNVTLLDDVSKECFVGSSWQFIPNNNTGMYTIINNDCSTGERYFIFTIQEVNAETGLYDFLLKPTNEKNKSETNQGFRLKLTELSDTDMQWQQTISVDGIPFIINMNFTKL